MVPSSPSFVVLPSTDSALEGKWRAIVPGTPGMRGARVQLALSPSPQGKAGENSQPGGWLCKSSLQETVGYAGGKLPAGVANDWVTRRSPSSVLRRFEGEHRSVFLPRPLWRPALSEDRIARTEWWLNVQSGLQDPGNNTLELLQSA